MKFTDKETYQAVLDYASYKGHVAWWKTLILGIMGGMFIAIGYFGAFALGTVTSNESALGKWLFAAIFPTGIIFCVFLGGSLFTSDSLTLLPVLEKETKLKTAFAGWGIVFIGNAIGGLLMSLLALGMDFFSNNSALMAKLADFVIHKQNMKWYAAFFSAIGCNFVVAGSTWMTYRVKSSGAKLFLLWLPISLFAAVGFQHIIANFFIFFSGLVHQGHTYKDNNISEIFYMDAGKFILNNLLPTTLGNWFGGAVLIPLPYFIIKKLQEKRDSKNNNLNIFPKKMGKNASNQKAIANTKKVIEQKPFEKLLDKKILKTKK